MAKDKKGNQDSEKEIHKNDTELDELLDRAIEDQRAQEEAKNDDITLIGGNKEDQVELSFNDSGMQTVDQIQPRQIEETMRTSYLNYAMSVIASRALPDVRDGLKPVHRRIMYAMYKNGLTPGSKYSKSASTVGEVMKYYHPHGDSSIYNAMVRLAQPFSLRYPLVDGQGNFGSIDGDGAAAMRYTESRMSPVATYMVQDIAKDTVDMGDNYDGSTKEPTVLPAVIPQLLINGQTGIAVGMATEVPPHNLSEVTDALVDLLYNPELTIEEIVSKHIQGPDLPTGGTIYGADDILAGYKTGRGRATVRAKAELEEDRIIITEIPYQINKSEMLIKIAALVRDKKIEGIKEIRDESNKDGIRIVFEIKRDASPEVVLNMLYKQSELQSAVYFNLLALVNRGRQPKLLNLKEILQEFLQHRDEVVTRRTKFDLKKAEDELHILDGLKIALDHIDRVIAIIRASYDKEEASKNLQKEFSLSDKQAEAILQMRLQTLTNLDKSKIEEERNAKIALIAELRKILENDDVKKELIAKEMKDASAKLASPRRTKIVAHKVGDYNKENFVEEETVLLQITNAQYIKYLPLDNFSKQARGGRGKISFNPRDNDFVKQSVVCSSHDYVYAFTSLGRVFRTRVFDLPAGTRQGRGQNLVNYLSLQENETVASILTISKDQESLKEGYLIFGTKNGVIKRTPLDQYSNIRTTGIIAIGLKENDSLVQVVLSTDKNHKIVMSANNGKTVIFDRDQVSAMGRTAGGVRGIKLKKDDQLISLELSDFDFQAGEDEDDGALISETKDKKYPTLLVVTENGFGKQTFLGEFRKTNRAASGVKTLNITKKTGKPVLIHILDGQEEDLIVTTKNGVTIRINPADISHFGRATQGVKTIKLDDQDVVVSGSVQ